MVRVEPRSGFLDSVENLGLLLFGHLLSELFRVFDRAFDRKDEIVKLVPGVDLLLCLFVLLSELFGLFDEPFDLFLREPTLVIRYDYLLALAGSLVLSSDVHNAIGVNFKGYLDLGCSPWSWRQAFEVKLAQLVVVFS